MTDNRISPFSFESVSEMSLLEKMCKLWSMWVGPCWATWWRDRRILSPSGVGCLHMHKHNSLWETRTKKKYVFVHSYKVCHILFIQIWMQKKKPAQYLWQESKRRRKACIFYADLNMGVSGLVRLPAFILCIAGAELMPACVCASFFFSSSIFFSLAFGCVHYWYA